MQKEIVVYPGNPQPLGFSVQGKRANFAVFSSHASKVVLGVSGSGQTRGSAVNRPPASSQGDSAPHEGKILQIALNRSGDVWHVALEGWSDEMEYAFSLDPGVWLADPASQTPASAPIWGQGLKTVWSRMAALNPFDWQNAKKPAIPKSELVIYEMHVRGFTAHPSSRATHRGTYLGIIEKIPYLRKLGINAVELMPIFEFDETPPNSTLRNFWGYDPLYYFAPMRRYAAGKDAKTEFKTLIRELHKNGIEVILDVVYNHTGEAGDRNFQFSFRGLDDSVYYMVDSQGKYRDFSGCKNTVNSNHPVVMKFILASLRYWVEEMQVDGFRFDLASIFTRGVDGKVLKKPPILEAIANDPVLNQVKLISESWDATGLYQLGTFPDFGPWSEWNGKYRDRVRNFIKGTDDCAGEFADVISGSEVLYRSHSPISSINFITAHDGYSLRDLVSYEEKHNESNGQKNQDGNNQNFSWNCGAEGPTSNSAIEKLRERQMRNFLLALFLSQGIPMILMGDEYGHTRRGNNNPYVQDNEINWFLWDEAEQKPDVVDFVSSLIQFRKMHPELRRTRFLLDADVDWHGPEPLHPDWSPKSRFVACTLKSARPLYIAFNADSEPKGIALPPGSWRELVRTDRPWSEHHLKSIANAPLLQISNVLAPYSALLAIG